MTHPTAEQFGREIAAHAMAQIRHLVFEIILVETQQERLDGITDAAARAITAAAHGRQVDGMAPAEVEIWKSEALAGFHAAMAEARTAQ
jgi:hypothetical protein